MDTQRILERWYRFAEPHRLFLDALLAAVVALVTVVPEFWEHMGDRVAWRILLGVLTCVALAFRRTRPDASGIVIAGLALLHIGIDTNLSPAVGAAAVIGLYSMAAYGSARGTRAALILGIVGGVAASGKFFSAAEGALAFDYNIIDAVFLAAMSAGIWATGMLRRTRIREVATLRERARLLELERVQEAELAAVGERTRIAREMHDIIAHTLTVVIAQADGGRYAAEHDPAAATRALATIADNGRQALADMRSLLGVLRDDGPRDMRAVPGIGDLPELVDAVRAGGLPVRLETVGGPRDVSAGCGLTAFRIVQESLTNILKHAGADAAADVELQWGETDLTITVTDNGRGGGPGQVESGGKGVLGMRERAELHGGTLRAGARSEGPGYRVSAVLPIGGFR
jgi:signal transduction histidine kinase